MHRLVDHRPSTTGRTKMHRARFGLVVAIVCLTASTAQAGDKVTIGFLGTMSGPNAPLGIDQLAGFRLAVQMRDGHLGGLMADVFPMDDELKPDVGVLAAKKLVESSKADVVVGTTFSNVLMAVVKPVTQAGIFLIGPNAGPSTLAGAQCNPNFFAVAFENTELYVPMGQYLNAKNVKRVVALAPNYQGGRDAIAGFKKSFKGEIINEVYTSLSQLDY